MHLSAATAGITRPAAVTASTAVHRAPANSYHRLSFQSSSPTSLTDSIVGQVSDGRYHIPYRLFVPVLASPGQTVPLILFLHGRGDGGTDNISQTYWMSSMQANTADGDHAAFVLAPQLRTGWNFGTTDGNPTEGLKLTMRALQQAMANPNVDVNRIYVTGVSAGAYGVWDALRRYPKLFAAGVPMSYAGSTGWAKTIAHIPVWAFQGSNDPVRPAKQMRKLIAAIVAAKGSPKYTEIAGGGHYIWDSLYNGAALYEWLFAQAR